MCNALTYETISLQLYHNLIFLMLNHAMLVISIAWNDWCKKCLSRESNPNLNWLSKIDLYYAYWVQKSDSLVDLNFQQLWKNVMIRSASEAKFETVGSIMGMHSGKNRHLEPEYFSQEIVLLFSLGPLH